MSSVLVESPVTASQLHFSWGEESHSSPITEYPAATQYPANQYPEATESAVLPSVREDVAQPVEGSRAHVGESSQQLQSERCNQPVRMGALMIQLLKGYGITDEEIAQGLADYARRTCSVAAS